MMREMRWVDMFRKGHLQDIHNLEYLILSLTDEMINILCITAIVYPTSPEYYITSESSRLLCNISMPLVSTQSSVSR